MISTQAASCATVDQTHTAVEKYQECAGIVRAAVQSAQIRVETPQRETEIFPAEVEQPETNIHTEPEEIPPIWQDIPLDVALQYYIADICKERNIDASIVLAVIWKESRYEADAIGDGGKAQGLMQIQERWHAERMERLACENLLDPFDNVTVGIDFLDEMLDKGYGVEWALTAYNGGEKRAHEYRNNGTISAYAAAVLEMAVTINT